MKTALIVTTYNRADALNLVLKSILNQSKLPDEVIIADDGSSDETSLLINNYKQKSNLNLVHAWQPDEGFRAARVRNLAASKTNADYLIFIDGDMVLHPMFIEHHCNYKEKGCFIQGSRVLLNPQLTQQAIENLQLNFSFFNTGVSNKFNSISNTFLAKLFSKKVSHIKGVRTCNFAIWAKDFKAVNGFNEAFEGWGREDSELVVRLMNKGINRKNLKFAGVAYHLYHKENNQVKNDKILNENDLILNATIKNNNTWCDNGLNKHL